MESSVTDPKRNKWFVYAFFGFLLAVMLGDLVSVSVSIKPPGRRYNPAPLAVGWSDLKLGTFGTKLEAFFEGRSFIHHGAGALYNEWFYRLTGRLPGLVKGRDGWLFLRSNVAEIGRAERDSLVEKNARLIREVHERMESRGIRLVVVLTPDRSRVYPLRAYGEIPAPSRRASFLPMMEERLTSAGEPPPTPGLRRKGSRRDEKGIPSSN